MRTLAQRIRSAHYAIGDSTSLIAEYFRFIGFRRPEIFSIDDIERGVVLAAKDPMHWRIRRDVWNKAYRNSKNAISRGNHNKYSLRWGSKGQRLLHRNAGPILVTVISDTIKEKIK